MKTETFHLTIVGSGPAGLAAAAHAAASGMDYVVLERTDHLADTVHCYQKRKYVMAEPAMVPLRSEILFQAGSRESVLEGWSRFVEEQDLNIRFRQEVSAIERQGEGFRVRTQDAEYQAAKVVLALGTQGNPRRLGAPGEDLPQVSNRLVDPDDFQDQDIVVVGAGDSALEVALALCEENRVSLIVRTPEIVRAKEALENAILARAATGQVRIHFSTTVKAIEPGWVDLNGPEEDLRIPAQQVILKIGATPPRKLLESFGVEFTGPGAEARPRLNHVYESTVPGLFLIGAVTGRDLIKLGINQGYEVVEHLLGREVEPADEEVLKERLPFWAGSVRERIATARGEIPLFGAAEEEQLRELFLAIQVRGFDTGETVIQQNDYTDSLLVVAEGRVGVWRRPEEGAERKVAELHAGNFFGEMSLISNRRRNATVRALQPTRLIEIPRKAILKLLHTSPGVKEMVDQIFLLRAFQGYLFPEAPDATLWELVSRATLERLEKNRVIFQEGDEGDAFYLIRSGMVKISKRSGDREVVLTYLVAGHFFGETALLSQRPRSAAVTTIFPTELIRIGRQDFQEFLERHPTFRERMEEALQERRLATLIAEGTPNTGNVLSELIREEVVIGTDTLLIDEYKCVRCNNCIRACEGVHDDGQARLSLTGIKFYNVLAPNSCWQCENPLCMIDCPPDAILRDPRGEIYIKDNCIGCGNCAENCPYDNIFMVEPKPRPSLLDWVRSLVGGGPAAEEEFERTVAVKCDLCRDIAGGPACVRSCPTGAAIRLTPEEYRQTVEELVVRQGGV